MKECNMVFQKMKGTTRTFQEWSHFLLKKENILSTQNIFSTNSLMEVSIWLTLNVFFLWLTKIFKEIAPIWKYTENLNGAFSVQLQKQKPFLTNQLPALEYGKKIFVFV